MLCTKHKTAIVAVLAISLLGSFARAADVTVKENITYGTGGNTELKLDIAQPEGDGPFPAIVFIHGGGWYQGSRQGYVSDDDPPVLTLHGDRDALVPIAQATTLDERMKQAGASHTLMVFEGQGHGFGGEHGKRAMDATWSFFDQHLKPINSTE